MRSQCLDLPAAGLKPAHDAAMRRVHPHRRMVLLRGARGRQAGQPGADVQHPFINDHPGQHGAGISSIGDELHAVLVSK